MVHHQDRCSKGCSSLFIPWRHSLLTQSGVYLCYDKWGQVRKSGLGSSAERKIHSGAERNQERMEAIIGQCYGALGKIGE